MSERIVAGLDIGNGYVKGLLKNNLKKPIYDEVDIPSGVSLMTSPTLVAINRDDKNKIKEEIENLYNRLDISFHSPLVSDEHRRLFGERSLSADGIFTQFNIHGNISKADQPLSKILVLGLCAAKALKDYYKENGKLPDGDKVLKADVKTVLALPITEFNLYRDSYTNSFSSSVHTCLIHNFEEPIIVKLTFSNVRVLPEGASAFLGIKEQGEALMNLMLKDVRSRGFALEGITSKDILEAENIIGVDIGEGTVNFPVFTNYNFNVDASTSLDRGFGTVLDQSIKDMINNKMNTGFNTRKQLANFLAKEPSKLKRAMYDNVSKIVDSQKIYFADEVANSFGEVLSNVGTSAEVVYVYGGGANPMKSVLYDKLIQKVTEMLGSPEALIVLYLDSSYSRVLNREGLFLAAESLK